MYAYSEEFKYRAYVTDCLAIMNRIDQRYVDMVKTPKVQDKRNADEVIRDIRNKLKGG